MHDFMDNLQVDHHIKKQTRPTGSNIAAADSTSLKRRHSRLCQIPGYLQAYTHADPLGVEEKTDTRGRYEAHWSRRMTFIGSAFLKTSPTSPVQQPISLAIRLAVDILFF